MGKERKFDKFEMIFDAMIAEEATAIRGMEIAKKFKQIGQRHGAKKSETVGHLIHRAAAAGDKEAIEMLPILDELVPGSVLKK